MYRMHALVVVSLARQLKGPNLKRYSERQVNVCGCETTVSDSSIYYCSVDSLIPSNEIRLLSGRRGPWHASSSAAALFGPVDAYYSTQ